MALVVSPRRIFRVVVPKAFHVHKILRSHVRTRSDGKVMSGPFAGMRYIDSSFGSAYFPKLLGTYERELAPDLVPLFDEPFERIVVAGAAEGYYAVGLALKTGAEIIAFEAHPDARSALSELLHINGMAERVRIEGICDAGNLRKSLQDCGSALVLMDIEGGESILLDPAVVRRLATVHILVELHEFLVPGVTALVKQRFSATHVVRETPSQPRAYSDFPVSGGGIWRWVFEGAALQMMQEGRPAGMSWLVMTPNRGSL